MSILAVYLLTLSALVVISIVVLRVPVRHDYLRKGYLSLGTATLQTLVFFVFGGFPSIYLPGDWPVSNVNLPLRVIGLTSIIIGLGILLLGMFRLGILRSLGLQTGVLKETSSYRVSRNPQVLGCVLYVIGFIILWPSWYALVWGLSLLAILHVMVLTEEQHLRNIFGQDYEQYCKRVPRYLGFPKKTE